MYRKIPIISPGLTFAQKAFFAGLIFGGAYFRRGLLMEGICVSNNGLGLTIKTAEQHHENSLKQLALTVHGLIFGRAYYRKDFLRLRF